VHQPFSRAPRSRAPRCRKAVVQAGL